ncbi:MAG: mannose-1-phosphate guanylyltransferase/mannose-6-phosphate isomerase [Actinomycetota bacterium]
MTDRIIVPVVLSGGAGSRLWPASRSHQPKQLLPLVDERTMFITTIHRSDAVPGTATPLVVCNETQRLGIRRDLVAAGHPDAPIILEPVGRNTAPAAAAAALHLIENGADPILFILPADHVIKNEAAFGEAVTLAADIADKGYLVTFGIDPTGPETGYGYIRFGERLAEGVRMVEEFREKPDARTAEEYISSGRYLWNSGMFMFRASRYLAEIETHAPAILDAAQAALDGAAREGSVVSLDGTAFASSPSTSIDYAVMEHTESAAVVPIHTGWSDVGSWSALWEIGAHDDHGNVLVGDIETIDVQGSYIRSDGRLVAAIGLDNVVIIDSRDATLVTRKDRSQDVKEIVERLKAAGRPEVETDGSEMLADGVRVTIATGTDYRVTRTRIEPGGRAVGESDEHRRHHLTIVAGTAHVLIDGETRTVSAGEAAVAGAAAACAIVNASETEPLEFIDVAADTHEMSGSEPRSET